MCGINHIVKQTFEEAIQQRVRIQVTQCEHGKGERWTEIRIQPQRVMLPMSHFDEWPDSFEGQVDGYTYRAVPTVNEDQTYALFELEVIL